MRAPDRDFAGKLSEWHRQYGRHDLPWQQTRDPYRIWVSEIMLQQTQVGAVTGYFGRFLERFPDVEALANASEDDVLRLWSGLGYYARARNLHKAARQIVGQHQGRFPSRAAGLAQLPGIGRSTAAAIAAFAFGERAAILDGNVKRVLARRFGIEGFPGSTAVESRLWALAESLLPAEADQGGIEVYTQALMDLGATVCTRAKPACQRCPLSHECVARIEGRVAELPAARPAKKPPVRQTTWLILQQDRRFLFERRPSSGLWGGLWVFPEYAGEAAEISRFCRTQFSATVSARKVLPCFTHAFTHFKLEITPVLCRVTKPAPDAESHGRAWLEREEALISAIPVPVRSVLQQV